MSLLQSLARSLVIRRLSRLRHGSLRLIEGKQHSVRGPAGGPQHTILVHDPRFYPAILFGGSVGAGEAYGEGWWTTDDLPGLVQLLLRDREVLDGMETGWARLAQPLRRLAHALRANTRRGSRENIRAHYDLGNDFFREFLDGSLTYSCALFERTGGSLQEAQEAKYARMAALVDLRAEDHVLEIGTGWGGFAVFAATRYGCRVTTTTISRAQHEVAVARVRAAGLDDRVTVLLEDYRDLRGRYDKLVSIEMIEAIGHAQYPTFFARCAELLTPAGRAAIQAIVIADARYESARREVDFIKRHIFPGSCIPSRGILRRAAGRTDLREERMDEIGAHYVETLRQWRTRLAARRAEVRRFGFDDRTLRLWDFYFGYCEGGFRDGAIGTVQLVLAKPEAVPVAVRAVPGLEVAA
jgi:cyclopropane-fatty-acyl-phospholipid synthase